MLLFFRSRGCHLTLPFAAAADLTNARPRALAVTAVCRQMGRNGVEPNPETKVRLDALLAGLDDPW